MTDMSFTRSLNARMLLSQLLAAAAAALVFLLVGAAGRYALENIYLSPESVAARQAALYAEFNGYVSQYNLAGTDTAAITRWSREHHYVTVLVYAEEELENSGTASGSVGSGQALLPDGQLGRLYPMRFSDGSYQIAIVDSSEDRERMVNTGLAALLAAIAYIVIQLSYTGRLTRRIVELSRGAAEVSAGDLEKPITARGKDEIAALARDMDQMRRSVIERLGSERRAWEANSELITAMSHDIRTPMTSLLGYLGLLNNDVLSEEERQQYTASAYGKAMELKDLTDELFRYFLVFGRSELELDMAPYDASLLLEQLLGEAECDLREAGFEVQRMPLEGEAAISADPMYLKRVLDNLVSNIKKYADRERPVMLLCERTGDEISVCFSNAVAPERSRAESTRIGLRTCEKIMTRMGGRFLTRSDEEHFAAELTLPLRSAE